MTKAQILLKSAEIQGWMKPLELVGLYELTDRYLGKGGHALEVGSWKGKSSIIIASICAQKGGQLTCIDTFTGSENNEDHYKEALKMGADKFRETYIEKNLAGLPVLYIIGNSRVVHQRLKDDFFDVIFIDGNHNYPVIDEDINNYYPKTKKGKIFICHDYEKVCPDVIKAVDKKFKYSRISVMYESLIGIIKE